MRGWPSARGFAGLEAGLDWELLRMALATARSPTVDLGRRRRHSGSCVALPAAGSREGPALPALRGGAGNSRAPAVGVRRLGRPSGPRGGGSGMGVRLGTCRGGPPARPPRGPVGTRSCFDGGPGGGRARGPAVGAGWPSFIGGATAHRLDRRRRRLPRAGGVGARLMGGVFRRRASAQCVRPGAGNPDHPKGRAVRRGSCHGVGLPFGRGLGFPVRGGRHCQDVPARKSA